MGHLPKKEKLGAGHCPKCGKMARQVRVRVVACNSCKTVSIGSGADLLTATVG